MKHDAEVIRELFRLSETDKTKYATFYAWLMERIEPRVVLEIGVAGGGGMRAFRKLWPQAKVFGVDIDEPGWWDGSDELFIGDQEDPEFIKAVMEYLTDHEGGIDLVIDDGGHTWNGQLQSFWAGFPLLAPGGTWVIEDLETSYLGGYSHGQGLSTVEYLKQVMDCLNWQYTDTVRDGWYLKGHLRSIYLEPRVVAIEKNDNLGDNEPAVASDVLEVRITDELSVEGMMG